MNLLLDTCALLWALQDANRLSGTARKSLQDPKNSVLVSAVSFWEISLKSSLGKLKLDGASPEDLPGFVADAGWQIMALTPEIAASFRQLPLIPPHRDPFDRLLVWIALCQNLTLVSRDGAMRSYASQGLRVCW